MNTTNESDSEVNQNFEVLFSGLPPLSESEMNSNPAAPNRPDGSLNEIRETLKVPVHLRYKSIPAIQMEFHMTIRAREKLGPKKTAILLTVLSHEALEKGIDISSYLSFVTLQEFCRSFLKQANVNLDATKKALALSEAVVLAMTDKEWISLGHRIMIDPRKKTIIQSISWYPDKRTLGSWTEFYKPERFLELQIVQLEQFQERPSNTIPYSGYTKGYHESGKGYHRDGMVYGEGKTPFDPEIDEDRVTLPLDTSSLIDQDPEYVSLMNAISKAKRRNTLREE